MEQSFLYNETIVQTPSEVRRPSDLGPTRQCACTSDSSCNTTKGHRKQTLKKVQVFIVPGNQNISRFNVRLLYTSNVWIKITVQFFGPKNNSGAKTYISPVLRIDKPWWLPTNSLSQQVWPLLKFIYFAYFRVKIDHLISINTSFGRSTQQGWAWLRFQSAPHEFWLVGRAHETMETKWSHLNASRLNTCKLANNSLGNSKFWLRRLHMDVKKKRRLVSLIIMTTKKMWQNVAQRANYIAL